MLDILLYAVLFYVVWQAITGFLLIQKVKHQVNEAVDIIEQQAKNIVVVFERVKHNDKDVILCYDTENNFVAQGFSKEEVIELAQKRFPNRNIATFKREELQWINNQKVAKEATIDKK
jgi:predicted metal-dependent TIM-barrel fold hydrolase